MKTIKLYSSQIVSAVLATTTFVSLGFAAEVKMQDGLKVAPYDPSVFRSDPSYADKPYNLNEQLKIYGDKQANENPRPLLELGRNIYDVGQFSAPSYIFGNKNPIDQQLVIYGDWRTAIADNDNGAIQQSQVATRLNLDVDYKITATERIHATITPLEKDGRFTRHLISGAVRDKSFSEGDSSLDALYFEGDLGAIVSGPSNEYTKWDLPFAIGLMPLQFQNGIWVDDAFAGMAFTIPHINSAAMDISNMDITFFAGIDKVSTALVKPNNQPVDGDVNIFGVTAFIEALQGYFEIGYGFTDGKKTLDDQDYHNVMLAYTSRYGGWLSNSVRLLANFGQDRAAGLSNTADGTLILIENSFITSKPSTLIPYFNLFAGYDRPQSLARATGAGGILKNTGILFESDGLTGYPTLDATANDTYGGALGIEYLFALDQQVILEVATVQTRGTDVNRNAKGDQTGIALRYQVPLSRTVIFRADVMAADRKNEENLSGARIELRVKF